MQIASALKKSDLNVFFIQESKKLQEKTPDLMVKAEKPIYIECKYRGISERERNYSNVFNEFYWRVMRLMYNTGKFYSVCIEWQKDPTIEDAIGVTDWLRDRINNGEQGHYSIKNAQIWIKLLAMDGEIFDVPIKFETDIDWNNKQLVHIMMGHCEFGIFNGKMICKEPTFIMFRNIVNILDDLLDGVIELVNKAYSQIPKNGPSVIFVETRMSFNDQDLKESLEDLQSKLERKLQIINRVNIIDLTKSYFNQQNMKVNGRDGTLIRRMVESKLILNKTPSTPLTEDFQETIAHLKYW